MFVSTQKWTSIAIVFLYVIIGVNVQMPVPMYPGPPSAMLGPGFFMPLPPPPPPPVFAMPPPIAIRIHRVTTTTSTTTTTTTTSSAADSSQEILVPGVAIPYPVPMGPIAMPAFPPPPPCGMRPQFPMPVPPRMPIPIPQPMPLPQVMPQMMGPPPIVVVPFPPMIQASRFRPRPRPSGRSKERYSDSCSDSSSSSNEVRYKRYHRRRRVPFSHRRNFRREMEFGSIKPMLTWRTNDGHVKYKTHLSVNEAESLLKRDGETEESRSYDGRKVQADITSKRVVLFDEPKNAPNTRSKRQQSVHFKSSPNNQPLKTEKKKIILSPLSQKKVSNLYVAFDMD